MIVNLKTNYEHNGKLGELVKPCCNTLYCIRLDVSGTVLKIKPENVLSLQPAPYISEHSIFLHLNKMSGRVWDYVRIHEEPGKGQGVQATVDIAKGTRLINCPEEKQIYFFMPSRGGLQYEPDCYALEMTELNTPKLTPRTQYFVDALYDIFLVKRNFVCVQAERYIGNVCLNGGCKKCGLSVYTMAALKEVKFSTVQNDGTYCNAASNQYVVDNALLASKYQLNDIIMTVDFILQNICKIEPGQVKAFTEHVWRLVGIWKLNAFAGYMPIDTVTSILDPLKNQTRIARTRHIVQWLEKIKVIGMKIEDTNTLQEEKSEMFEQITRLKVLIQETGDLVYPALKTHEVTDGMYDQLGYGVHVSLHAPYITKINGGEGHDEINCQVVDYIHKPSGIVRFPEDTKSYLLVNKNVAAGDFLCIQYNDEKTSHDGHNYFESNQAHTIKTHASESPEIVELIHSFSLEFKEYLPQNIIDYFEYCTKFARAKQSIEISKMIEFIESINFESLQIHK